MINNPFYIGIIVIKRTGETFPGIHEPLVTKSLFDQVRMILNGRTATRGLLHDFPFRKFLTCADCGYRLRGEVQKGRVYYRCHSKRCSGTCVREDGVDGALRRALTPLVLAPEEWQYLERKLPHLQDEAEKGCQAERTALALRIAHLKERLNRLTDAYIDRMIEKETFEERKMSLLMEQKEVEERQAEVDAGLTPAAKLAILVELARSASLLYEMGTHKERRDLLKIVGSNCQVVRKNVEFRLLPPFQMIANRQNFSLGGPSRGTGRTWDDILASLQSIIATVPLGLFERISEYLSERRNEGLTPSPTIPFPQAFGDNGSLSAGQS
jgi:hypothetical protein